MGGLHAGHSALIRRARDAGNFVVVSVFVNPTQFGPGEDYLRYPRDLAADAECARRDGCDLIFAPSVAEMYPPGDYVRVEPGPLADRLCGPFRPGHFAGVCTIVGKLFNIVRPDAAYFGAKDYQQAEIVRALIADLNIPIRLVICPTVREHDGLACSTRNAGLSPAQRRQAPALFAALCVGRDLILSGERSAGRLVAAMRRVIDDAGPCRIDYMAVADPETLTDVAVVSGPVLLAAAIRLGSPESGVTRLIDSLLVDPPLG